MFKGWWKGELWSKVFLQSKQSRTGLRKFKKHRFKQKLQLLEQAASPFCTLWWNPEHREREAVEFPLKEKMPHTGDTKQLESSSASCSRSPANRADRAEQLQFASYRLQKGETNFTQFQPQSWFWRLLFKAHICSHSRCKSMAFLPKNWAGPSLFDFRSWPGRVEVQESHGQRFIRSWCHQPTSHTQNSPQRSIFHLSCWSCPTQTSTSRVTGVATEGRRNSACSTLIPKPLLCFAKWLLHQTTQTMCWASPYIFGPIEFLSPQGSIPTPGATRGTQAGHELGSRNSGISRTGMSQLAPWSLFPEEFLVYSF